MILVVAVVLSAPFLWILATKPVMRRLAVRNAVRRPRESLLVIAGSLLGTAIMTGSFVVGDAFASSIRAFAYDQLGPTDEVVATIGLDGRRELAARFDGFEHPEVDGMLPLTRAMASSATVSEPRRAAPTTQILEVDFGAAVSFGGDEAATGISGATPEPGRVAVGRDLADHLEVAEGDEIEVFAYGTSVRLTVDRVLPKTGVAGLWLGRETNSPNVFVAPGTIEALLAASADGMPGEPPVALMLVSNEGGVVDGAAVSDDVERALLDRVEGLPVNVATIKADLLALADENGRALTELYAVLGMFAVLAGILLLVNIFVMLAEERKSELGMMRALGLRRSSLVGAFSAEGWCYAVVSSVIGTFAGLALGRVVMVFAQRVFNSGAEEFRLALRMSFEWSSIQAGFTIGFAIAVLTVVLTSLRICRFNIIQAIRDISETVRRRPGRRAAVLGAMALAVGASLTLNGFAGGDIVGMLTGPPLAFIGLAPFLARRFAWVAVSTTLASLSLAWGIVAVPVAVALDAEMQVVMFFVQGAVMVGAAIVIVTQHQDALGRLASRVARRSLDVRLGLAYPLARRFRTAMTLSMFALVMFVLVYVTVLSHMFGGQLDRFTSDVSGGFDAVVKSSPTSPIPLDELVAQPGVRAVAPLVTMQSDIVVPGDAKPTSWPMSGFDESLIEHGPPILENRGGYPTDEAAYRAVLADATLAIVDDFFLAEGAGPPETRLRIGDEFTISDPLSGAKRAVTVAAIAPNDWVFNGGWVGVDTLREVFGDRAVASRAYVAVDEPTAFAASIADRYLERGGESETIRSIVSGFLSQQQQFFALMRGYLTLGLVVGVAGIGVIMVRAVRERRRQVGVLRAIGFEAAAVRRAFVVESSFVALEGVLIGTLLAFVATLSMTLTPTFGEGLDWSVPPVAVALLVTGTLGCALLATLSPARAAARIKPAVALRITD